MNKDINNANRNKISVWIQAIRAFSFTASITSVIIATGAAILLQPHAKINWFLFPIVLFGAVLFHSAANLISEYYDFKQKVDTKESLGSSRVLVDGLLSPNDVLKGGFIVLLIGFLLGMILVYLRGINILYIGLAGVIGVVFYGANPFKFKYIALGDLIILLMFGPLLALGAYMGLTGDFNWKVVWISIPEVLPVVGILHANNTRDIMHDTQANIRTVASTIGIKGSKMEYTLLLVGTYLGVVLLILTGILKFWVLITFLSLPIAIKLLKEMSKANVDKPHEIAMLDVKTAQYHTQFGILYFIGILLSAWL